MNPSSDDDRAGSHDDQHDDDSKDNDLHDSNGIDDNDDTNAAGNHVEESSGDGDETVISSLTFEPVYAEHIVQHWIVGAGTLLDPIDLTYGDAEDPYDLVTPTGSPFPEVNQEFPPETE